LLAVIADFVLLSPLFSKFLTSYRHEENYTEKTTRDSNYACPHIIVKYLYNQKLNYIVVVFFQQRYIYFRVDYLALLT
jgi:hypothetical protein